MLILGCAEGRFAHLSLDLRRWVSFLVFISAGYGTSSVVSIQVLEHLFQQLRFWSLRKSAVLTVRSNEGPEHDLVQGGSFEIHHIEAQL